MDAVRIRDDDRGVRILQLNRPHAGNALDGSIISSLRAALADLQDVTALVLTGAGAVFCTGGDVTMLTEWHDLEPSERKDRFRASQEIVRTFGALPVPTVAAVNGPAAGAGLDLALHADLAIASDRGMFVCAFTAVGLIPDLGGAWLLPRIVGWSRAKQMLLANERVSAESAASWGLVSEVVEGESLIPRATELAWRMAQYPRAGFLAARAALSASAEGSLDLSLRRSATTQSELMDDPDHRAATRRFLTATSS